MTLALICHPDRYAIEQPLNSVIEWAVSNKVNVRAAQKISALLSKSSVLNVFESDEEAVSGADLIVAIGGDGTMLHTAHLIKETDTPVIGINTGKLGFMANIQADTIREALSTFKTGEYLIDERYMLRAELNSGEVCYALNEFLFSKKDSASLISVTAEYDGMFVNKYLADGIIVASPTGSTAYNLSAGGPIVMPGTPVMVLTPINPHTLTTRPLVLPSARELTIRMDEDPSYILFSYDGRILTVNQSPFEVKVRQSDYSIRLVRMPDQDYFQTLRNKLMWGMDVRGKSGH